jgi:hypothetical protein
MIQLYSNLFKIDVINPKGHIFETIQENDEKKDIISTCSCSCINCDFCNYYDNNNSTRYNSESFVFGIKNNNLCVNKIKVNQSKNKQSEIKWKINKLIMHKFELMTLELKLWKKWRKLIYRSHLKTLCCL